MKGKVKSLSKREIGFILVIAVALIGVGAYAWRMDKNKAKVDSFEACVNAGYPVMETYPEQCSAFGKTFVKETETYRDSAGRFEITYPTTLVLEEDAACCEGEEPDWKTETKPFKLKPLNASAEGNFLSFSAGTAEAMQAEYKNNWEENGHPIEPVKLNESDADYAHVVFEGDAERYADSSWLIYHFNMAVYATYREYHQQQMSGTDYTVGEYADDYQQTVSSIRFL